MATTLDFGSLGTVEVPPEITTDEGIQSFGLAQMGRLQAQASEMAGRAQAREITAGRAPMPSGISWLPNRAYPLAAGLSRGLSGLVQIPESAMLFAADLPYDVAQNYLNEPELADSAYNRMQWLRDAANAVRETTQPYAKALDLPMVSMPSVSEAWAERGPLGVGEYFGERFLENLPQLGATVGLGLGLKGIGLTTKAASLLAPILGVGPMELAGSMEEQIARTGTYSPVAAGTVGAINAALETVGSVPLLRQILGEGAGLVPVEGVGAMAGQIARKGLGQFRREGTQEAAQEFVGMNVPPAISDNPWIPAGEQFSRAGEAFVLGGLLGGPASVVSDVSRAAVNPILWDPEMQQVELQRMATEAAHRVAVQQIEARNQAIEAARLARAARWAATPQTMLALPPPGGTFTPEVEEVPKVTAGGPTLEGVNQQLTEFEQQLQSESERAAQAQQAAELDRAAREAEGVAYRKAQYEKLRAKGQRNALRARKAEAKAAPKVTVEGINQGITELEQDIQVENERLIKRQDQLDRSRIKEEARQA